MPRTKFYVQTNSIPLIVTTSSWPIIIVSELRGSHHATEFVVKVGREDRSSVGDGGLVFVVAFLMMVQTNVV